MSDGYYNLEKSPILGKKMSLAQREKLDQDMVERKTKKRIEILKSQEKEIHSQMTMPQQSSSQAQSLLVRLIFNNYIRYLLSLL